MNSDAACRLYLITPPAIDDLSEFAARLPAVLDAGDVACLQVRLKPVDDDTVKRAVAALLPVCDAADVAVILNDRPDLAATLGCDGVHIGPEDTPYAEARRIVGPDATVGVSAKTSRHTAMALADAGADYIAFGAFYPSSTKVNTEHATPDLLEIWTETTTVPCVAIGGITPENCAPLISAGADFLAVSAGVWSHVDGPEVAVRLFSQKMAR